ncbi:MAG: hypothetical protein KKF46_04580 [Nanoarchaeota archaeon]|nr:hypothetical protein [Nanoarchaeota archaeon]MBU1321611.1 hypothetical protein [Nanoarchaeota archaeon]MBU1597994.1 hypothetical protein [Nanoarchaeota archaeon]MBU2440945.1 hypothetical protein [Nanoarchaeota archaeon]
MSGLSLAPFVVAVIIILVGVILAALLSKIKKQGKPQETNYYAFFVLGISFLPLGIVLSIAANPGFMGITGLGFVYLIIGLANKDKWKKKAAP